MKPSIHGVGINDLKGAYPIKFADCVFYKTWKKMLGRCYDPKYHETRPTYAGCSVVDEWKYFSKFKAWMETQDWEGKHLEKDILGGDNKVYSPENCVFIDKKLNSFLTDCGKRRGEYPIGVSWSDFHNKFRSACSDGSGKNIHLGSFDNPEDAHKAWRDKKYELIDKLFGNIEDKRIIDALKNRFGKD